MEHVVLREHLVRNKVFQEPDSSDFEMGMKQKTLELKVQGFPIQTKKQCNTNSNTILQPIHIHHTLRQFQ